MTHNKEPKRLKSPSLRGDEEVLGRSLFPVSLACLDLPACYILIHLSKLLVSFFYFLPGCSPLGLKSFLAPCLASPPSVATGGNHCPRISLDLPRSPSLPPTLRPKGRCLGLQVQLQETASFISTWRKTTAVEGVPCKSAGGRRHGLASPSREQGDKGR